MGVSRYNIKTKKSKLYSYSANGIRLGGYAFAGSNDYICIAAHYRDDYMKNINILLLIFSIISIWQ